MELVESVLLVNVSPPARVASVPVVGKVTPVVPVEVSVVTYAPTVASVLPSIRVKVALLVGWVIVTLLIVVAVAEPIVGVTKVGLPSNTKFPVPVAPVDVIPSNFT